MDFWFPITSYINYDKSCSVSDILQKCAANWSSLKWSQINDEDNEDQQKWEMGLHSRETAPPSILALQELSYVHSTLINWESARVGPQKCANFLKLSLNGIELTSWECQYRKNVLFEQNLIVSDRVTKLSQNFPVNNNNFWKTDRQMSREIIGRNYTNKRTLHVLNLLLSRLQMKWILWW